MSSQNFSDGTAASGGRDLVLYDEQRPLKPKRGPDKQPRNRHRTGQLTLSKYFIFPLARSIDYWFIFFFFFSKSHQTSYECKSTSLTLKWEELIRTAAAPPPASIEDDSPPTIDSRRAWIAMIDVAGDIIKSVPRSLDELQCRSDALRVPAIRRLFHMVVIYRWIPSLSGKTVLPADELVGVWHLQRSLEDDAMLEAEICSELHVGSDRLRSHEDHTAYLGCLTRSIARLRREIRAIGAGAGSGGSGGPAMLSDPALMTAYVLAMSGAHVKEEPVGTGLFGDPILLFDQSRSGGHLKAFFRSTHFAQVRSLAMRGGAKGMKVPDLLAYILMLYASYQLIPPGFAFPEEQLLIVAQGVESCRDIVAKSTDVLLAADADFLYTVHCTRVLARLSEARDDVLGKAKYASLRTYVGVVQHQLLNIRRADPAIEIYMLGALLFAYGAIGYVIAPDCLQLLAENLVDALEAPRYTENQPPELLFWAAMLGAMGSAPKPGVVMKPVDRAAIDCLRTSKYLIAKVEALARILGLKTWEEVKVVLEDFVWAGHNCDKGAKYIWDLANPVGA
ncbi:hypothetical protein PG997_013625 [Apiospora hydei]|uniref:Uncharacterized protein n=1 Tax=Apiospora hydei TaxID=1337664 RepID=A0ABR1V6S3_9PEZI